MFVICFISQWMKRSKHGLFIFSPKKTLCRRNCSIGQSCCSMTSKRSISWFLESSRAWSFFIRAFAHNQPKATRVCIRSINQSNRSISVRLLFLLCSRVFIPRSYENRSKRLSVNEVSGQIFQPVENSSGAVSTWPKKKLRIRNSPVSPSKSKVWTF